MATGEPTNVQAKAFAPLDLPPECRVGDRLAERMGRMAPPDADPGPTGPVEFRQEIHALDDGYRQVRL